MGLFDHFKKRRPTREQLKRLSRITNPQQREALLKAIARAEEIPAYAWDPLPADFDTVAFYRRVQESLRASSPQANHPAGGGQPPSSEGTSSSLDKAADVGPGIIAFLFTSMGIDEAWSVHEPRSFTWWGHRLAQRVWAAPARDSDGFAVVRLGAETDLLRNVPNTRAVAERLAALNHHATMSAFIWDPAQASVSLRCVAYAHPETAGSVRLLFGTACGLQAADAHIKVDGLAKLLDADPAVSAHPTSGPRPEMDNMLSVIEQVFAPSGAEPAPFSERDFAAVANSRVIPWLKSEAKGLTLTGLTSSQDHPSGAGLMTLSGSSRHPQLGSGLLSVLRIPIDYEPDLLLAVCHELNWTEATTTTARSYLFGAWCPQPKPQQGLAFASFIPTASCRPGLVELIALSMAARAAWARKSLEAAASERQPVRGVSREGGVPQNVVSRSMGRVLDWQSRADPDHAQQHTRSARERS